MNGLEELCERASNAAAELGSAIASGSQIRIISHNDVDGICSGTVVLLAVMGQGGSAHLRFSGHVYQEDLADLLSTRPDFILFCDMGSDQISRLRKSKIPYLVIDHHATDARDEKLVNPYEFGVDGTREVSASGVAYLVAKALNPENISLSPIALCGAFGDMQILKGANERIATDAESKGLVKRRKEIRLIGRVDRPVEYSLCYSTLPFIKDLSGNPMAIRKFLGDIGVDVDPKTTISELNEEMERALISGIAEKMVKEDASTFEAEKLFGTTFHLPGMKAPTIEDMVDYLESCCAFKQYSTALSLLIGDPGAAEEVERCRLKYKEKIFEGVGLFGSATHMSTLDYIVLEGWTEYSGKLSSIYANAGYSGQAKPVFALNLEDDTIKVSGRMNPHLVQKGLDLGKALSISAERFGGSGGGHDVAAGAKIPRQFQDEFIKALNKEVGMQLDEGEVDTDE